MVSSTAITIAVIAVCSAVLWHVPNLVRTPGFTDSYLPPLPLYRLGVSGFDYLDRLQTAVAPANAVALKLLFGYLNTQSIYAGTKLGVFDLLATEQNAPKSLAQITRSVTPCERHGDGCEAAEQRVQRLLRLVSVGTS